MKLLGFNISKAPRMDNETRPHPDNWALNWAWFNDLFLPPGEYQSKDGADNSVAEH